MDFDMTWERREELIREEERAEGRAEGQSEGEMLRLIGQIQRKLKRGKNLAEIADEVEETAETVRSIVEVIQAKGSECPMEEILTCLKSTLCRTQQTIPTTDDDSKINEEDFQIEWKSFHEATKKLATVRNEIEKNHNDQMNRLQSEIDEADVRKASLLQEADVMDKRRILIGVIMGSSLMMFIFLIGIRAFPLIQSILLWTVIIGAVILVFTIKKQMQITTNIIEANELEHKIEELKASKAASTLWYEDKIKKLNTIKADIARNKRSCTEIVTAFADEISKEWSGFDNIGSHQRQKEEVQEELSSEADEEMEDIDLDEIDFREMICPSCGEELSLPAVYNEQIYTCPLCGERLG